MKLVIELLSDTAPGSGAGEVGGVDRTVVFNAQGFPYIPARRIKGCLKEAALEVDQALKLAKVSGIFQEDWVTKLFGKTGQPFSGWIRLGDAHLKEADILEDWLKWANSLSPQIFNTPAVRNYYTGLRTQTRISRVTGGALENSLRVTRLLKAGLEFEAPVELIQPQESTSEEREEEMRRGLGLACKALCRLGLSRNRGPGEIKVDLQNGYSGEEALAELTNMWGGK